MLPFMLLTQIAIASGFVLLNNKYNYYTKLYSRLFEREGKLFERENLLLEKKPVLNSTIDTEIISEVNIDEEYIEKNIRTGRSSDEDGKTNIWSVEPTMEIDNKKTNDVFKLLGIFLSVTLVTCQFFLLTNPILPDPSDY